MCMAPFLQSYHADRDRAVARNGVHEGGLDPPPGLH